MRNKARLAAMAAAGLLGVATAAVAASGDDDLKACAVKKTGELRAAARSGKCGRGEFAITISGDAFKKGARGGTLTINGVSFKRGAGRTITINGNTFRAGTLPNTLTINGTSFRSSRNTLTINGTSFGPGAAAGPTGPAGPAGPPGPAGTMSGPAPVQVASPPPAVIGGDQVTLAALEFRNDDGKPHRLLLSGGFDLLCNAECQGQKPRTTVRILGGSSPVSRRAPAVDAEGETSMAVSDILIMDAVCNPCTVSLSIGATGSGGASAGKVVASNVRVGYADLGPVSP